MPYVYTWIGGLILLSYWFAPDYGTTRLPVPEKQPAEVAFQLSETGLITEGIAYDAHSRTFFISSVHARKLIQYRPGRGASDFSQPSDSLWGVFGMKIDPGQRLLWACSSALSQAEGVSGELDGRAALVCYNLKNNRLLKSYPLPIDGKPHLLGDLTITQNGTVYCTDSRTACIYQLKAGEKAMTSFLADTLFRSLQGLALSDDDKTLFVADYSRGPLAIDIATKRITRLQAPKNVGVRGIDGLYYYKRSLVVIQNGRKPYRVSRLYLNRTATAIEQVDTLVIDHPLMTEPTLGTIVGNQFYYIANSQWEAYDEAGKPVPNFPAQKPTVLKLPLP